MFLPETWDLPDSIKVRFGRESAGKQRAMYHDEHLLLVLYEVPQAAGDIGKAVFFWRPPDGVWDFSGRGRGLTALENHVEAYERRAEDLRQAYQVARRADDHFALLEQLAPALRAAQGMHATLQAARESVRLDNDIIRLRDRAHQVERDLDMLYLDAQNALDLQVARQAEAQGAATRAVATYTKRLGFLAGLFLPVIAAAAIFGPLLSRGETPSGPYWVVVGASALLGLLLGVWARR